MTTTTVILIIITILLFQSGTQSESFWPFTLQKSRIYTIFLYWLIELQIFYKNVLGNTLD